MDVYSCASVNWRKIIGTAHKMLSLAEWRASFLDRQIDEGGRTLLDISGSGDTVEDETVLRLDDPRSIAAHRVQHKEISVATVV